MRISLRVASTSYHLAGESGVDERVHSSAADIEVSPDIEEQSNPKIRSSTGQVLDRGNLLNTITFSTTRKFSTPALAEQFLLDHDQGRPRSGTLWLDTVAPDGTTIVRRYMAGAVVRPPKRRVRGCTVILNYTVRGGAITSS